MRVLLHRVCAVQYSNPLFFFLAAPHLSPDQILGYLCEKVRCLSMLPRAEGDCSIGG